MEIFKLKACSPPGCGCPTLLIDTYEGVETVTIEDDHDGMVCMTIEEFKILAEGFLKRK